jgi:gluconokinase
LKRAYRDLVRDSPADVRFLYLQIEPEVARERVGGRKGHFFDQDLVASQFEALEPPRRGVTLDATRPVEELVGEAIARFGLASDP